MNQRRFEAIVLVSFMVVVLATTSVAQVLNGAGDGVGAGAALFQQRCSVCHSRETNSRAPSPEILSARSPEAILDSLVNGAMRVQGSSLSGAERRAIAEYVTGRKMGGDVTGATAGRCPTQTSLSSFPGLSSDPVWNGWGGGIENTRFQDAKQAGLTAEQVPHLTLKWALGFPDATSAWSQPTVAGGRLFIGSQNGTVYSLEPRLGASTGRSAPPAE